MIGVIPNPKKSFQIEKSISEVKQAVEHLTLFTAKYKLFKANPVLNQFTFEAFEFLSLGVYIDINCFSLNDQRTEVSIEVKRKIGSFDKSHEVSLANTHLSAITDLISESISADPNARLVKASQVEKEKRDKEEALKNKIEEERRKSDEEKQNNPALYYTKQALLIIASITLVSD